jgi:hypothetical protein
MQMAQLAQTESAEVKRDHYRKSAEFYLKAGTTYPADDENRACASPLSTLLHALKRLHRVFELCLPEFFPQRCENRRGHGCREAASRLSSKNEADLGILSCSSAGKRCHLKSYLDVGDGHG